MLYTSRLTYIDKYLYLLSKSRAYFMQCTWVVLTYMTMVHVRKKIALDLLALIWSMAALDTQKCRGILEILFSKYFFEQMQPHIVTMFIHGIKLA